MSSGPVGLAGLDAVRERLGTALFESRMERQRAKTARLLHQGEGFLRLERYLPLDRAVTWALRLTGLESLAFQGFLSVQVREVEWRFPRLPRAFEGFRLLQLTDLHCDLDPRLTPVVTEAVKKTPHDAAVITGDFRNKTSGSFSSCIHELRTILPHLASERFGVLGNHDFLEMVPPLELAGLPILLNESGALTRGGDRIWIAGVDDPHFYRTHDLQAARKGIPRDGFCVLLAHSPEIHADAAAAGYDFQLSGHTHAGQLCLPGGRHLVLPCKVPHPFIKGPWKSGRLHGYTSPGTGSCGVAARLNCPPEITLHRLHRGD